MQPPSAPTRWPPRHWRLLLATAVVAVAAVVAVLAVFQPQDLFINHTVDEALPQPIAASPPSDRAAAAEPPAVIAQGDFRSGEHSTTGLAQAVAVPGRGTFVRLSHFRTSNGPAVHVWLSAASVTASNGVISRATHLDLGGLKGNIGNQNYAVPDGTDLSRYHAVVIWCRRFDVSFGTAPLA